MPEPFDLDQGGVWAIRHLVKLPGPWVGMYHVDMTPVNREWAVLGGGRGTEKGWRLVHALCTCLFVAL